MEKSIFRKESIRRVSSPERLNEYLKVTSPLSWVSLGAVILLVASLIVWLCMTSVDSFASGKASVHRGVMTLVFDDEDKAKNVEVGMNITVGDELTTVKSVGRDSNGRVLAAADADLPDGSYEARVGYKSTQLIKLLFN